MLLVFGSCALEDSTLPILGEKVIDPVSGQLTHYKAPIFELTNQSNQVISNQEFENKIQVVDFFFTSCPTICPQMTNHLTLVQEAFAKEKEVAIISYSINPKYDTPEKLLKYAERYDIDNKKWSLLTGDSEKIFELAKDYKVSAFDDSNSENEDNLIHDGTFVLVDGNRHIRGYYNGLELSDVNRLIKDIKRLLKE
jgi:protein SCO1/2